MNRSSLSVALAAFVLAIVILVADPARDDEVHSSSSAANTTSWARLYDTRSYSELSDGSDYGVFLKHVELSARRFRDLGLELWATNKDPGEVGKWFLITVNFAPDYPSDFEEWIAASLCVVSDQFSIDNRARDLWDAAYPEIKEYVLSSGALSPKQTRHLLFGELKERVARALANGGREFNEERFLNDVRVFSDQYVEPFGEVDASAHNRIFVDLLTLITSNLELFFGKAEHLIAFYEQISGWDNVALSRLGRAFLEGYEQTGYIPGRSERQDGFVRFRIRTSVAFAGDTAEGRLAASMTREVASRRYREVGVRKFETLSTEEQVAWLAGTLGTEPTYPLNGVVDLLNPKRAWAQNIPLDIAALQAWEEKYAEFAARIFKLPDVTTSRKSNMQAQRVKSLFGLAQRLWALQGDKRYVSELQSAIVELASDPQGRAQAGRYLGRLVRYQTSFGLTTDDSREFLRGFEVFEDNELNKAIEVALRRLELLGRPFEFAATYIDGNPFDMLTYRDKVVLVDHWATTCSSCIAAMPDLHELYLELKSQGFEVISIVYDGTSKRRRVDRVINELSLTWPTVDGEGQWQSVRDRYGYNGFPQYMLLNRKGELIADTADLFDDKSREAMVLSELNSLH